MPLYDRADLIDSCKRYSDRPENDLDVTPVDWDAWLTEAQHEIYTDWSSMAFAGVLYAAPQTLVTDDDGLTFMFPGRTPGSTCFPMGRVEVKPSAGSSVVWRPGVEWSRDADIVLEGDRIRFPRGSRVSSAPVARYIMPPEAIGPSNEPTLRPPHARTLLVYRALQKWASKGGQRDPKVYEELERKAWFGDPAQGKYGILGMLQTQFLGMGAAPESDAHWTSGIDTGDSYPNRLYP